MLRVDLSTRCGGSSRLLAVLRLLIRSRKERGYRRAYRRALWARAAGAAPTINAPLIWVHAVSVGETRAAQPLIEALMKARPDARILLTHMTPSGRATGEQIFGDRVLRSYLPYDMPQRGAAFSRAWRPSLGHRDGDRSVADADRRMPARGCATRADQCAHVGALHTSARRSSAARRSDVFGGFARVLAQCPVGRRAAHRARRPQRRGARQSEVRHERAARTRRRAVTRGARRSASGRCGSRQARARAKRNSCCRRSRQLGVPNARC